MRLIMLLSLLSWIISWYCRNYWSFPYYPRNQCLLWKLLKNFDKIEKTRLTLLKRDKVEEQLVNEKNLGDDKIHSDDEEDDEDDIVGEIDKDIEENEEEVLVSIAM
jgi:hypothetical protein